VAAAGGNGCCRGCGSNCCCNCCCWKRCDSSATKILIIGSFFARAYASIQADPGRQESQLQHTHRSVKAKSRWAHFSHALMPASVRRNACGHDGLVRYIPRTTVAARMWRTLYESVIYASPSPVIQRNIYKGSRLPRQHCPDCQTQPQEKLRIQDADEPKPQLSPPRAKTTNLGFDEIFSKRGTSATEL
jgi:hypothetical protein